MEFSLEIYQTENGKQPFREWLNSIKDNKTEAIIRLRLRRLELGNFGNCESVGNGVIELKIDLGPGIRVYFGRVDLKCILLLCAGNKHSQRQDIVKAKAYLADYIARGDHD